MLLLYQISLLDLLFIIVLLYVTRSIYRLFFHPLSHIPGPALAAITYKWMAYYDLVYFGKLIFKIEQLHEHYGPVVRIGPNELHVFDLDSYYEIFKSNTKFDVDTYIHQNAMLKHSLLSVSRVQDAKPRRDAYMPYFSKQSVRKLEPLLQDITSRFFATIDEHIHEDRAVDLTRGFKCFALEVVTQYCFARHSDAVAVPDFHHPVVEAFLKSPKAHRPKQHFPWLWSVLEQVQRWMPLAVLRRLNPSLVEAMVLLKNQNAHIRAISDGQRSSQATVFDGVIRSSLEKSTPGKVWRLSTKQLQSEAGFFIAAGMDTTSHTLEVGIWGLLNSPAAMERLVRELTDAIPYTTADINVEDVEHLPYLNAVIKESLRLAHGIPGRLLRIVPPGGHLAAGFYIPAGITVGHSTYLYHTNENVFRSSRQFVPERWLASDTADMERNLLSFSRGSRSCLGMTLAFAELYLMFASLLRRYEITNAGTTEKDMEWRDFFVPYLNGSLKVTLTKRAS